MREPINAWTHLIGACLSALGLLVLLVSNIMAGEVLGLVAGLIFGLSMIALYMASTVYHGYRGSSEVILKLKKLDHAMIFVLIAGTYTPICLLTLKGWLGIGLLIGIWALAFAGIVIKLFFVHMPRGLSAGIYLFMGWLSLAFIVPLFQKLPPRGFLWLVLGGVLYTIGSIFYARKINLFKWKYLGFHEIFHLFIMAGTLAHFILIQKYVM